MSLIVSGGLILEETGSFTAPPSGVTLPITETFSVADAPPSLYGDYPWAAFMGPVGWKVTGGTAHLTGQGFSTLGERLNVDLGTDDYSVTAPYPLWSPDTSGFLIAGPLMRAQGTSVITFYSAVLISGTPTYLYLYRFLAGAQTVLGTPVVVTPHTNMTVSIRGVGNLISVAFDGTQVIGPVNDPNIPTGRYAGIEGVAPGLNAVKIDNLAVAVWPVVGGGDTTPPTVTITTPTIGATYATATSPLTTLGGSAADDVAVTEVTWSNNRGGSGIATGTATWTVPSITLQPGDNVLTVLAKDAAANISPPDTLTVTYTPVAPPVASVGDDAGGQLMIIQNTTFERKVRLKDTSGLAVTGATLAVTLAKGAGAFAVITPTVTEQGTGWYNLALTAAHNDTIGSHTLYITAAGAVPRELFDQVVTPETIGLSAPQAAQLTAIEAKTAPLPTDPADQSLLVSAIGSTTTLATAIKAKTDQLAFSTPNIVDSSGGGPSAAAVAAAVRTIIVETEGNITLQQAVSEMLAAMLGVTTDAGRTRKTPNGNATRAVGTFNAAGERTGVTLTPSG